jgi:hypothetical protein
MDEVLSNGRSNVKGGSDIPVHALAATAPGVIEGLSSLKIGA